MAWERDALTDAERAAEGVRAYGERGVEGLADTVAVVRRR
jgi:hypothetical protein